MNFVGPDGREFLRCTQKQIDQNTAEIVEKYFLSANELSGEKFTIDKTNPTERGQSRALMIADTAMSNSPLILIDEIEMQESTGARPSKF